jgi:two-component system, OmpR family, response regulator PfeR
MNSCTKILILDSDPLVYRHLAKTLSECGHEIIFCHSADQGLLRAVSERFDLILLGLELPDKGGLEVLRSLRKSRSTPVAVLSEFNTENTRIEAYREGADDYWAKPFNFTEMCLRVEALLRRTRGWNPGLPSDDTLQVGPLQLNRQQLEVRVNGHAVPFTQVQFKLLWYLASHQNEVVSKAYLHTLVLEKPYCRHDRSIDMHLSRVRKKLVELGLAADRVQTVHGKGYCFA